MHVELLESNMRLRREYRYSDLGFYLFKDFVEQQYNTTLDYLTDSLYYAKLGAATLTFNPLDKFPRSSIVPTEQDKIFRKQLVHGYVHDYGAAMQGGVGGHAGLFGNANDLAKMFQMYLQKGTYGGVEYFSPYTIDLFTSAPFRKYNNRRALGFDKPGLRKSDPASSCTSATFSSYGHTGFTGTIAWVEPQCELVYVFLSNRIYPDIENEKLLRMNTRTDIQQVFYDAILKGKKEFVPKKAEDVFQ